MAHKTLIGGTAYEISGGKTLVNGTAYSIKNGKTLVDGTAYEVGFSQPTAILYSNGALVFQSHGTVDPTHGDVIATYTGWGIEEYDPFSPRAPWYDDRANIKTVSFADKVAPKITTYWFHNCSAMTSFDGANLDTSAVTSTKGMFYGCSALTSLNLSSFDTSAVTNIANMFNGCLSLKNISLSSFRTGAVTNTVGMFSGCSALTSLDLSSFDTSAVTSTVSMFYGCSSLTTIYASELWSMDAVLSDGHMFYGCTNLKGDIGYNDSYRGTTYAKTSGGYLTYKSAPNI